MLQLASKARRFWRGELWVFLCSLCERAAAGTASESFLGNIAENLEKGRSPFTTGDPFGFLHKRPFSLHLSLCSYAGTVDFSSEWTTIHLSLVSRFTLSLTASPGQHCQQTTCLIGKSATAIARNMFAIVEASYHNSLPTIRPCCIFWCTAPVVYPNEHKT